MAYTFVRFKSTVDGRVGSKWWLEATDRKTVIEHSEKYLKPKMQDGFNKSAKAAMDSVLKHGTPSMRPHPLDVVSSAIEKVSSIKYEDSPLAFFYTANDMLFDAVNARLTHVANGIPAYLENGPCQFGYCDGNKYYEIAERVQCEELKYPDEVGLTIDDVRYIQWPGGCHWYAKVGSADIVDAAGNQKWNEKSEAEEAAKWYIENFY